MLNLQRPPIQSLNNETFELKGFNVDVLRLDEIHPDVSGNKWFKLKHNIADAQQAGYSRIVSFGGPHSNHLHALAAAGKALGVATIAIVRGYEDLPLTPCLAQCCDMGMELHFVDKKQYRQRYDEHWLAELALQFEAFVIPEGGNNAAGKKGCVEISSYCAGYDEIWLPVGTGATFKGIASGLNAKQTLVGVMALKGASDLVGELVGYNCLANLSIVDDAHWGGFGKCPDELIQMILKFDRLGLALDPVYTAKMVSAFWRKRVQQGLPANKRYLLIHTGGLQGRGGIKALEAK